MLVVFEKFVNLSSSYLFTFRSNNFTKNSFNSFSFFKKEVSLLIPSEIEKYKEREIFDVSENIFQNTYREECFKRCRHGNHSFAKKFPRMSLTERRPTSKRLRTLYKPLLNKTSRLPAFRCNFLLFDADAGPGAGATDSAALRNVQRYGHYALQS